MSFSAIRDIFIGRLGADYCVRSLLFLKSPSNAGKYLVSVHKVTFSDGDTSKNKRWNTYPRVFPSDVVPIGERDLSDPEFMRKQADKLSFDISRFIEFLDGYTKVDDDIRPIMLHYSMIYLFDFFSRTWLKYERNRGHGIRLMPNTDEYAVKIDKSGIFPRAIDAFYLLDQSSLFSVDDDSGIGYYYNVDGGTISERIEKMKYSECPKIHLTHLLDVYEKLGKISASVSKSNPILVGYVILFIISSISRYKAENWFKIREDRNLKNKFDLMLYNALYHWTPDILQQTILRKGLKEELGISEEYQETIMKL